MPCRLELQINANAGRNEIVGWQGGRLKIKVKAPAVDGKANEELIRFLSEQLAIHRRDISIERGETSTVKLLTFPSMDETTLYQKLGLTAPGNPERATNG